MSLECALLQALRKPEPAEREYLGEHACLNAETLALDLISDTLTRSPGPQHQAWLVSRSRVRV